MPKCDYTIEQWRKRDRDFVRCSRVSVYLHVGTCVVVCCARVCTNNSDGVKENGGKKEKNVVSEDREHEIVKIYVRCY